MARRADSAKRRKLNVSKAKMVTIAQYVAILADLRCMSTCGNVQTVPCMLHVVG